MNRLKNLFVFVIFAVTVQIVYPIDVADTTSLNQPSKRLKDLGKAINNGKEKKQVIKKKQNSLSREIRSIQKQTISLSKAGQELERRVSRLQSNLENLASKQQQQMYLLESNRKETAKIVSTLYHFHQRPVRSFVLYPGSHKDAMMAEVLMRYWGPALQDKVIEIEDGFSELADLRNKTHQQLDELRDKHDALKTQKKRLKRLVSSKNKLLSEHKQELGIIEKRLFVLSRESDSIQSIIEEIRVLQRPPNPRDNDSSDVLMDVPSGVRLFPVNSYIELPSVGQIESGGEWSHDGSIRIVTLINAQVVAPFDGKVVHVGNFKRFGNLIIIEHLGGFHSILWRLNRIDVSIGQWLLAGEPVGWSGCQNGDKCDKIGDKGIVYMQLRKKEVPVDPLRWFKPSLVSGIERAPQNDSKVRG